MAFSLANVPLIQVGKVEIDFTGANDFVTKTEYTCELFSATFTPAAITSKKLVCRTGAEDPYNDGFSEALDTAEVVMWYNDAISATDDNFDDAFDAKGSKIAIRAYPAGSSTNARYYQVIGLLNNVVPPTITMNREDMKYTLTFDGKLTITKVA